MFQRQDPYFRAAVHHALMEAECRESASRIQRSIEKESSREGVGPGSPEAHGLSELPRSVTRLDINVELLRREREQAEKHARMRENMQRYL